MPCALAPRPKVRGPRPMSRNAGGEIGGRGARSFGCEARVTPGGLEQGTVTVGAVVLGLV